MRDSTPIELGPALEMRETNSGAHGVTHPPVNGLPKRSASPRFDSHPHANSTAPSSPTTSTAPITKPSAYPQPGPPSAGPSGTSPAKPRKKMLSTHLVQHPSHPVSKAIRAEFPHPNPLFRLLRRFRVKHSVIDGLTKEEMAKWEAEGKELRRKAGWKFEGEEGEGVIVSELFWKMYLSLMPTLERDPLSGLVPPDLLGSTTTMPLSIISLIPDIMQHYRDVIIRAQKEVFLATNYWQPSNSVNTITKSLKDLSALVLKEKRPKVVVKIMYDRGSWEQLWNSHAPVKPEGWTPLDLPGQDDVPGLDMEVINFHRVLLGTFHAKFLIVDRKVALLNSNNIQDRPNLELMSHFEGPIVDSFYEVALHSWYNRLSPPLPCMEKPYQPPVDRHGNTRYLFQDHNPYFDDIEILKAAKAARLLLRKQTKDADAERALSDEHGLDRFRDAVYKAMDKQRQSLADWKPGEELNKRAENAMHELREFRERWGLGGSRAPSRSGSRAPSRSGSRAPSRRASFEAGGRKDEFDQETNAITAHNATAGTLPDPSEAPSTPTVIGDTPIKAHTYPAPKAVNGDSGDTEKKPKPHVLFLDTDAVDGSGRLFDRDGEAIDSPLTAKSGQSKREARFADPAQGAFVSSPAVSTLNIPESPADLTSTRAPGGEAAGQANGDRAGPVLDGSPRDDIIATPRNDVGEALPISAEMPGEMKTTAGLVGDAGVVGDDTPERPAITRVETELPEGRGSKRMFQMSKMFTGVLSEAWATVEDSDDLDNFRPHVVHAPHEPFPIAMCCRKPHGFPGHHDIRNPQNAAWLAGFRYAKRKVFVQTPTLNARPIVRAIKQACRRGVDVILLLDLGFNDKGESIPFQGGTNEEVVDRLYKLLGKEKKEQYLKVYWYTGKDQVRPLNAVKKQRNCHIKFAAYDDEVMIIGNGNQDSQSWFHSQEVNVMIDNKASDADQERTSPADPQQVIAEMMDTLLSNQNTIKYGLVSPDGVWRDSEGKTLMDHGLTEKGAFRGLSGFIAFAKTI